MRVGWVNSLLAVTAQALDHDTPWQAEECSKFASSFSKTSDIGRSILNATHIPVKAVNISGTLNTLPLCRLFGQVPYPQNNSVIFELWLPAAEKYNGRFLVVGNGGMAGTIDEGNVLLNVNKGYAVAGGNAGHLASLNNAGNGAPGVYLPYMHDPEQVKAWIHNSIAYFTPVARKIAAKFYRSAPKHSYYEGCSTGGAQGFALAQFHPHLFDGIAAGCPGNWYSHLALSFLWNAQVTRGSNYLPQTALDLITQAVLEKCDTIDGVKDGVVGNPLLCSFDVSSLECASSVTNSSTCLTPAQVATAQKIYAGPTDLRSNASLYPGFSVGSETEWTMQQGTLANAFSIPILQNMVFNLTYDSSTFNWGTDVDALDEKVGTFIDEISPDLSTLKATGAKMLVFQSWTDPFNAATWPIQHLHQIEDFFGGDVGDWFRLFMIPGGGHCGAASNYPQVPASWHVLDALVQWVETGRPATEMLGTDPSDKSLLNKTSKFCSWPQTAKFLGGDPNNWNSFECRE
ncbi:feruloyl esterase [Annulohypoxylon maeteangense]|uniref:feruloyl esterase n=1 Tax=Annulohypoxylon maeteangense TaxID=1927788 RepID=UPI002008E786|nr:feruloyl esterase [Annulohypoxylon maeteangense]KAI0884285.1 feruloyl esterase [Annulohypoxylon maeteangense]